MLETQYNRPDDSNWQQLLEHLKHKIQGFEEERLVWLSRLESVRINMDERNKKERKARELFREVFDLKRALSECCVGLWEERMQRKEIQRENEELERKEHHARQQRMAELAGVYTEDVKQEIQLKKGMKPAKVTKFQHNTNDLSLKQSKRAGEPKGRIESMIDKEKPVKALYKTVVLPKSVVEGGVGAHLDESLNHHVMMATLKSEEVLRKEEELRLLREYENTLRDEIDQRDRTTQFSIGDLEARLRLSESKANAKQNLAIKLNEEYYNQRAEHDRQLRRLQEEKELLRLKNTSLEQQFKQIEENRTLENKILKDLEEKRSKEYGGDWKTKTFEKKERLEIVREQYKKVKEMYQGKISTLQEAVHLLRSDFERMKRSKDQEIKIERAIVDEMRKKLKTLGREAEARDNGLEFNLEPQPSEDGAEDTIDLEDLDNLAYRVKSIGKKLRESR